jgi:hypothetical protein
MAQRLKQRHGTNTMAKTTSSKPAKATKKTAAKPPAAEPLLLSGGNPQIAKGNGDAPRTGLHCRDAGLEARHRAATRCPHRAHRPRRAQGGEMEFAPFYGAPDQDGWFLSYHCFAKYVKVTFFRGTSLRPVPSGESRHKEVR